MSMEQFFTRDAANEGIEVPLSTPDGKNSDHWLKVLGADSDAFKNAEIRSKRDAVALLDIDSADKKAEFMRDLERRTVASLIVDWSFDMECSPENVIEFLKQAPQIQEVVNRLAGKRSLFVKKQEDNSTTGTDKN